MIIKISVIDLKEALNKILSVVDKKNTRLILNFIQIQAIDNKIEITATDLEVSAKITTQCIVDKPGTFCVNAKNIFDIVKELPDKELKIELETKNHKNIKMSFVWTVDKPNTTISEFSKLGLIGTIENIEMKNLAKKYNIT